MKKYNHYSTNQLLTIGLYHKISCKHIIDIIGDYIIKWMYEKVFAKPSILTPNAGINLYKYNKAKIYNDILYYGKRDLVYAVADQFREYLHHINEYIEDIHGITLYEDHAIIDIHFLPSVLETYYGTCIFDDVPFELTWFIWSINRDRK